jgi:hypothetical protein
LRVTLGGDNGNPKLQRLNVLHYDLQDIGEPHNDPQALADFFRDNVLPHLKALFPTTWTVHPVVVAEEIDPLDRTKPRQEWTSGAAAPGTRVPPGEPLPLFCTPYFKVLTNYVGRRYVGRIFPPGPMYEQDQTNGQLEQTYIDLLAAYVNVIPYQPDIQSGVSTSVANWAVYSRTSRAQSRTPYLAHVVSTLVTSSVHSMRSRWK